MQKEASGASPLLRGEHSLEFFNGQLVYSSRNGHGNQIKFVSLAAVTAAFRNAPIDSGWLPPGVVRCGSTSAGDFAVLFIPAAVHQLAIEARTRVRAFPVPLPSLVFFGMAKTFRVWAMQEPDFRPTSRLFTAPLPNVFENAGICWGSNKPQRAGVSTIRKAWELFINSPFNGHAANDKCRSHSGDVRGLLRKLENKRAFPQRELIPFNGSNLETGIARILGGDHRDDGE